MSRGKRRRDDTRSDDGAFRQVKAGKHTHVAELIGEAGTIGLRPWARRAVLAGAK